MNKIKKENIKICQIVYSGYGGHTDLALDLSKNFVKSSPINNEELKILPRGAKIFDIVYSPKETLLKKMCKKLKITYTNGLKMNFDQADKALKIIEDYYLKR